MNNDQELISVIIPTYKRSEMLENAINSVTKQSYKNIEIIVVDDNDSESIDRINTEKLMKKYKNNNMIKYIKHLKNKGGCAARNTGVKNSSGKYISFLDDDDFWDKDFLKKMIKMYDDQSLKKGAVYCNYYVGMYDKVFYLNKEYEFYSGNILEKLLSGWCPASTSFFLIKRECFETVGLFDENLKSFQDYDMWLRIAKEYEFDYTTERLVIKYEHSNDQVSMNPYKRQDGLNTLDSKLKKNLSSEQYSKFYNFKKKHQTIIIKNMILYNKAKYKKQNYIKLYIDYLKLNNKNMKDSVLLLLVVLFGINVNKAFEYYKFKLFKNRYIFIDELT